MKDKIGKRFQAVISGVTESTLYVELQELCISGAVPIELMVDDYYYHDPKNLRIFGEITLNSYTLGDRVTVELIDVNLHRKQLTFTIIREAPAPPEDQ
nr:MAG: hypothetical protein CR992_00735 [Desulfobacterales bacterium]